MTAAEPRLNAGDFLPGDVEEGPVPQRTAGSTLPATDDTAEAVRTRGERHIDGEAL